MAELKRLEGFHIVPLSLVLHISDPHTQEGGVLLGFALKLAVVAVSTQAIIFHTDRAAWLGGGGGYEPEQKDGSRESLEKPAGSCMVVCAWNPST